MMDTAPTADLVYQGICTLFSNTNPKEVEKANKWLEEFQKSVGYTHPTNIINGLAKNKLNIKGK